MATCKACDEPLVFRLDDDDSCHDVPDDLELRCGCHFHWQCLLDESATVALSLKCPFCDAYLPETKAGASSSGAFVQTGGAAIIARYSNEGGVEPHLDIMPSITEEAYLAAHPDARPARAFHVMCSEGDVDGIVMLLSAIEEDEDQQTNSAAILRYQDPLADDKSGLHLALENGQEQVALLLIWLCSTAPANAFPDIARQTAESMGVGRLLVGADGDIRTLKNKNGLTAEHLARQLQGHWLGFLEAGLLTPEAFRI